MPELPEVQTIVSDLNKKLKGHVFKKIWTDWPKSFQTSFAIVKKELVGRKIIGVRRRAKNILIDLSGSKTLLIHLKMTGHLLYRERGWKNKVKKNHPLLDPYNQYIRTIFYLDKNRELAFSDLRRFGEILLINTSQESEVPRLKKLGPEPLEPKFNFSRLKKVLKNKKGQIKTALLDQSVIAGIGNIYADEILWESQIHPRTKIDQLTTGQNKKLFFSIKKVLRRAVRYRGTSVADYRDLSGKKGKYQQIRKVYQRTGEPCPRCKTLIKKIKINGIHELDIKTKNQD